MLRNWCVRIIAVIGMLLVFTAPVSAVSYDIRDNIDCATARASTVCQNNSSQNPLTGSNGLLHNITRIVAIISGIAAVVVMVIAGISYITSNGEADAVSRAKKTIIFAAVGLVVIVLAQAIINYVISRV